MKHVPPVVAQACGALAVFAVLGVTACLMPGPPPGPPQAPCSTTLPPCPIPTPCPTATPTPRPTPTPTPTPLPPPTMPSHCAKLSPAYHCVEGGVPAYYYTVRDTVAEIMHVTQGDQTHYTAAQQKAGTMAVMAALNGRGYCTSYDLQAGNSGLASEMGVRQGADFAEWYQVFASDGYIRWQGMYRSTCTPAADEEQLPVVWTCWVQGGPCQ